MSTVHGCVPSRAVTRQTTVIGGTKQAHADPTTPAALGFRLPAEWERQTAVWLSWPHRRRTWPGHFRSIPGKFAEIVAHISRYEKVCINIARSLQERAWTLLTKAKADPAHVEFFDHTTDDCWCRDHGPIFLRNDLSREVAATGWQYNAWGGKYPPFDRDARIPARIGRALGVRLFAIDMVLEGGSIDPNGEGLLLTTESCLLNPNRNPHLSRKEIEQRLKDHLGVTRVLWLGAGIVGDDTDGHVDDVSRFFRSDGVVTVVEHDPRDANCQALAENLERLRGWRTPAGRKLTVVELPMPAPCFCEGQRLPASYANFLVINGAVLMPAFQQRRRDGAAAEILAGCFPGRDVVMIDCLDLVWGRGTLHCISQPQPA
jgi:agmatine deiminase